MALLQGLRGGRSLKVSLEPGLLGPLSRQARDAGSAAETGSFGLFISTPANLLISRILLKGCVVLASCTLASLAGSSGTRTECREGLGSRASSSTPGSEAESSAPGPVPLLSAVVSLSLG